MMIVPDWVQRVSTSSYGSDCTIPRCAVSLNELIRWAISRGVVFVAESIREPLRLN